MKISAFISKCKWLMPSCSKWHGTLLTINYNASEIINSDQGGHFTNPVHSAARRSRGEISRDGKGQCLDNARTERFFRTLKYDRIYINEYETLASCALCLGTILRLTTPSAILCLGRRMPCPALSWNMPNAAVSYQKTRQGA